MKKYGISRTFHIPWSPDPKKRTVFEEKSAFRQGMFFEKHQSEG